jgi:hypothetical protein
MLMVRLFDFRKHHYLRFLGVDPELAESLNEFVNSRNLQVRVILEGSKLNGLIKHESTYNLSHCKVYLWLVFVLRLNFYDLDSCF